MAHPIIPNLQALGKETLHCQNDLFTVSKRRLRKGTFSCWPCKKRKVKCVFTDAGGASCASCKKRGFNCISQELDERDTTCHALTGTPRPLLPMIEKAEDLISRCRSLTLHLHSLMPDPARAAEICSRGGFSKMPFQCGRRPSPSNPHGFYGPMLPNTTWRCPTAPSSPVEQAQSLIYLALCLQQLDRFDQTTAEGIAEHDAKRLACYYVDAASTFVTSQDSLVDSVDGVQLLLLETLYYVNNGNLRTAWLLTCRALAVTTFLLDLDLDVVQTAKLRRLHRNALQGERYFALLLGLNVDRTNTEPESMNNSPIETCVDALDSFHQVVLQKLVTRNRNIRNQLRAGGQELRQITRSQSVATSEIDSHLRAASLAMPVEWWATPSLTRTTPEIEAMQETGKLILQSHHFFMVMMTHQPSFLATLLDSTVNCRASNLGVALCVAAGRDTLCRFNSLRRYHNGVSYRGSDDKAYVAAAVILLAHIATHEEHDKKLLEYQRRNDLNLIHDVHETFTKTTYQDELLSTYVRCLNQLLMAEKKVAEGSYYEVRITQDARKVMSNGHDDQHWFHLDIPYFGTLHGRQIDVNAAATLQESSFLEVTQDAGFSLQSANVADPAGLPFEQGPMSDLLDENVEASSSLAQVTFDWAVDQCTNHDEFLSLANDTDISGSFQHLI